MIFLVPTQAFNSSSEQQLRLNSSNEVSFYTRQDVNKSFHVWIWQRNIIRKTLQKNPTLIQMFLQQSAKAAFNVDCTTLVYVGPENRQVFFSLISNPVSHACDTEMLP